VQVSKDHPRYRSLLVREMMSEMVKEGIVAPTGLIAHGRGEAFDYLIGEETTLNARRAERAAVVLLLNAKHPVLSVNGNAAALCAEDLVRLAEAVGARIEVNLFHRTDERVDRVVALIERSGGKDVLGRRPDAVLPGIASDRAKCAEQGIFTADVVLVPLEDGDRTEALIKAGKKVIVVDLNPLSRSAKAATVAIIDEVTRAVPNMVGMAQTLKADGSTMPDALEFDNNASLAEVLAHICARLKGLAADGKA
jgi:4-phosphopantoate--beta-alanine ligase